MEFKRLPILLILLLAFSGCAPRVPEVPPPFRERLSYEEKTPEFLFDDGEKTSLLAALGKSISYFERASSPAWAASSREGFSAQEIYRSLTLLREILAGYEDEKELYRQLNENFKFIEISYENNKTPLLLTGYYEPILEGSLEPGGDYLYPIYRRPEDLVETPGPDGFSIPYFSRKEIDSQGVLKEKGLELVWLKSAWDRFVLQVQGSGQIRTQDGALLRVGFAASNGRPYRSIGRYMIERGYISERGASLQRVKDFLEANPDLSEEIYNSNERYIFFREVSEAESPLGSLGVSLTPGRSIAADPRVFPPGAPVYLVSRLPVFDEAGKLAGWRPLCRMVLNQDTGSAIKGPSRIDFYFGSGGEAGKAAGEMKEGGKIYLLLAK